MAQDAEKRAEIERKARKELDNGDDNIKIIAENFLESYPPEEFKQYRYFLTGNTLGLAIQQGLSDLAAEACSIEKNSLCKFTPFTQIGDKVWPAVSETMDAKSFVEKVNDNPEAMFQ
ncbi:hypothetical protein GcM1_195012b [Golovinomyces cichoracearum]|uniref:Uncharacterized protein n=1 Tax=Golovinomyces cichoracearum TaxID=62708 RepID=A0A420J0D9_9PEZI|nr:hypothetical protein GcM1_195012b [Golovinomyces cichoracearum]